MNIIQINWKIIEYKSNTAPESEREILLVKGGEILGREARRRALERVVAEARAAVLRGDKALFRADHLVLTDLAGVYAVGAEFGDVFPKKHRKTSLAFILKTIIAYAAAVFY